MCDVGGVLASEPDTPITSLSEVTVTRTYTYSQLLNEGIAETYMNAYSKISSGGTLSIYGKSKDEYGTFNTDGSFNFIYNGSDTYLTYMGIPVWKIDLTNISTLTLTTKSYLCSYALGPNFTTSTSNRNQMGATAETGMVHPLIYGDGTISDHTASTGTYVFDVSNYTGWHYLALANTNSQLMDAHDGEALLTDFFTATIDVPGVTVSFNSNGGTSSESMDVAIGDVYGTLPTPTKTGYLFDGWYKESSLTNKVTSMTTVSATTNHTLYAKWTPNQVQYTVYHYAEQLDGTYKLVETETKIALTDSTVSINDVKKDFDGFLQNKLVNYIN